MEHEENCPWNQSRPLINTSIQRPCESRKCAVWKDLKSWFGYVGSGLSKLAFEEVFRDVAHGGSGLYERMAVEGGDMLREASRAFAAKKAEDNQILISAVRFIFHGVRQKKALELFKKLFVQKEVTIMNETSLLNYFAKSYLSAAQFLNSPRSVSNYVRVLLSYSLNEIAGQDFHRKPTEWLPTLLQHIYHSQTFRHLQCNSDNLLLRDLHLIFDYKYDYFLPRIQECFDNPDAAHHVSFVVAGCKHDVQCTQTSGVELLSNFASKYFCELYKAHYGHDNAALSAEYANNQSREFIRSNAIEVFACVYMRLHLVYIGEEVDYMRLRSSQDCRTIFLNLVGACWSISQKETRTAWMANLFHSLRQVQLAITMNGLVHTASTTDENILASGDAVLENAASHPLDFSAMFCNTKPVQEGVRPTGCFLDRVVEKTMDLFSRPDKTCVEPDVRQDNTLPIRVQYDQDSGDASVHIPLGKLGDMEPVNYRTVLKRKGERVMEIAVSNKGTLPLLDIQF
ncbi:hypothetical protein, conserved [Babesia bigemina]|uniref:Uncharacterized protein n=1 Tax=Babesia bigemina TaxID=5866 RepID=A0A061DBF1_BABBI|nr:hypothetical protein, conserved [Babesia bigemina]CDR96229.1 hypothetical protein, conserved [Babesia bigemina]|eukprot:XP_012768415.1 hypothetical protein, conserved [Babesia bigemina]